MSRRDAACGEDGEREAGRFKHANAFVGMDAFDVLRSLSLLSSPSSPSFASHLHEPIPSQTSSFPSPSLSLSLSPSVSLSSDGPPCILEEGVPKDVRRALVFEASLLERAQHAALLLGARKSLLIAHHARKVVHPEGVRRRLKVGPRPLRTRHIRRNL